MCIYFLPMPQPLRSSSAVDVELLRLFFLLIYFVVVHFNRIIAIITEQKKIVFICALTERVHMHHTNYYKRDADHFTFFRLKTTTTESVPCALCTVSGDDDRCVLSVEIVSSERGSSPWHTPFTHPSHSPLASLHRPWKRVSSTHLSHHSIRITSMGASVSARRARFFVSIKFLSHSFQSDVGLIELPTSLKP